MANIFERFWQWMTGKEAAYGDWRYWAEKNRAPESIETSLAAATPSPEATIPLGAKFRKPPTGFSMSLGQEEELARLLQSVKPLPQGALKVMQELDRPDASAATVAEAIQCEPVMAASMVRLANSSAIGLRREITSVNDSVAYLGFSTTKSLLLRFNMDALLPSRPGKGYDSGKLWVHAMAVAQVAEEIARRAPGTDPKLALTAGLLHDIGKLAINSQYAHAIDQLWAPDADPEEGLLNRERRLFQADHAIIGSKLAKDWKLPHDLVDIIRLHHSPDDIPPEISPEIRRALLSVHIANQLVKHRQVYCDGMEIDIIPDTMTTELGLPAWNNLLADAALQQIVARAVQLNGGTTAPPAIAA